MHIALHQVESTPRDIRGVEFEHGIHRRKAQSSPAIMDMAKLRRPDMPLSYLIGNSTRRISIKNIICE